MMIQCPECGKEISDRAESCPNCGFPMRERTTASHVTVRSIFEINGVAFDVLGVKNKDFIKTVANVSKKVAKLCKCEKGKAEEVVYGYFLATHGDCIYDIAELRNKINHIKSANGKKLYCPYCLSRNIDSRETVHESVSIGKSEIRKKSAVTRAGNKAGRAGMIMATGGLWALTPKKSDYKEVSKGETSYYTTVTRTCADCGSAF